MNDDPNAAAAPSATASPSVRLTWLAWFLGPGSLLYVLLLERLGYDLDWLGMDILLLAGGHLLGGTLFLLLIAAWEVVRQRRIEFWALFGYWALVGWFLLPKEDLGSPVPLLAAVAGFGCFWCATFAVVDLMRWSWNEPPTANSDIGARR